MKLKKLCMFALASLSFTALAAHANEVVLTANQPMKITFRIAHKNPNNQPVLGELQTVNVNTNTNIQIPLDNYDRAGVIIVSANGHELPPSANQFDKPEQCSMTTDKIKASGTLEFILAKHSISCRTHGGVFG